MSLFSRLFGLQPSQKDHRNIYDIPPEARQAMKGKDRATPAKATTRTDLLKPPKEAAPKGGPLLGLRIDVDTHEGMRDGVPRLLQVLKDAEVKGTFYLSFGPDRSGKAIVNALKNPAFLKKMLRTRAAKVYGLRTVLSGTLLPSRPIATAFPDIARRIVAEGHEAGVHAWDHRTWQDRLHKFSYERTAMELEKGRDAFVSIFGEEPKTYASPAWFCSNDSLDYQESLGLDYGSDCRGLEPFLPFIEGRPLKTPQVPSTLPTLDEGLGETDSDATSFFGRVLRMARESHWPVLTIHAELEGGPYAEDLATFLVEARAAGMRVMPLRELMAERLSADPPLAPFTMSYGMVDGRASMVSMQLFEV